MKETIEVVGGSLRVQLGTGVLELPIPEGQAGQIQAARVVGRNSIAVRLADGREYLWCDLGAGRGRWMLKRDPAPWPTTR